MCLYDFYRMKSIIVGTAGHIDHGKTALVKALTGKRKGAASPSTWASRTWNLRP